MSTYRVLHKQTFVSGQYSIVPLRMEDRWLIMQWRNEQIYHLRQQEPLTEDAQDAYFNKVVAALFDQRMPSQVLFSFLENDTCIGYGGLVHINWNDKNAEISFIMNSALEAKQFEQLWVTFLELIEEVAFFELQFHKIYVYAFDVRPKLYSALEKRGFFRDAVLREHCFFQDKFLNVVIYSKIDKHENRNSCM